MLNILSFMMLFIVGVFSNQLFNGNNSKLMLIKSRLHNLQKHQSLCHKSPWMEEYSSFHYTNLASTKPKLLIAVPFFTGKK